MQTIGCMWMDVLVIVLIVCHQFLAKQNSVVTLIQYFYHATITVSQ